MVFQWRTDLLPKFFRNHADIVAGCLSLQLALRGQRKSKLLTRIRNYTEEQDNLDFTNFAVLQAVLLVVQPLVQFNFF